MSIKSDIREERLERELKDSERDLWNERQYGSYKHCSTEKDRVKELKEELHRDS
jgi:hypothetical protein